MPATTLDAAAREQLRAELESVGGVRRAVIDDGASPLVYLICERAEAVPTEALARSILARHGFPADGAHLQLAYIPQSEPRRRVRFVAARVSMPRPGRALAEVELEWAGKTYREEMEGEGGAALELRLAALATLGALHGILGDQVHFDLVGIKGFRTFDADVVVAVLRGAPSGGTLIGAALATENLHRSAALAVLNATNRILGNFLTQAQD